MEKLAHELRVQREEQVRRDYANVDPAEWPLDHPDWGSFRFAPWGGPKARGGRPRGTTSIRDLDSVRAVAGRLLDRDSGKRWPASDAADALGVGARALERFCRRHGTTWPRLRDEVRATRQ